MIIIGVHISGANHFFSQIPSFNISLLLQNGQHNPFQIKIKLQARINVQENNNGVFG